MTDQMLDDGTWSDFSLQQMAILQLAVTLIKDLSPRVWILSHLQVRMKTFEPDKRPSIRFVKVPLSRSLEISHSDNGWSKNVLPIVRTLFFAFEIRTASGVSSLTRSESCSMLCSTR